MHVENEVLLRKRLDAALSQVPTCVGLLQVCSVLVLSSAELNGISVCARLSVSCERDGDSLCHTPRHIYPSQHYSTTHIHHNHFLLIQRFILYLSNNDVTFNSFRPFIHVS